MLWPAIKHHTKAKIEQKKDQFEKKSSSTDRISEKFMFFPYQYHGKHDCATGFKTVKWVHEIGETH